MDEAYRRENDKRIAAIEKDMGAMKVSTFDLHSEVREVLGAVKASQKWIGEAAQVGRDVRDSLACPPDVNVLCQHAELSAKSAVKQVFAILGVEIDVPKDVEEFRKDLRFGASLRSKTDKAEWVVIAAVIVALVGAVLAALWVGFKVKLGG